MNIRLDNHRKLFGLAGGDCRQHLLDRATGTAGGLAILDLACPVFGNLTGPGLGFDDDAIVTSHRSAVEAENLDRPAGACLGQLLATVVEKGTHTAALGANNQNIALLQGAALDQNRCHGTTATLDLGFDNDTVGGAVRVGLEFEKLGLKHDGFFQPVETLSRQCGYIDAKNVTTKIFGDDLLLQQVVANTLRIGARLVAFVDGDNHRTTCGLGMVDRLDRLRHDRVIGSNNENDDVGDVGTARTHLGEGLVARRINKGDGVTGLRADLVRADMLCNATGFAGSHIGTADCIEKACLAVVDMAHDGNDRGPRLHAGCVVLGTLETDLDIRVRNTLCAVAKLLHDQFSGLAIDGLGGCRHDPELHQLLDHIGCTFRHPVGKLANGQRIGNNHVTDLLDLWLLVLAHAGLFPLTANRCQ